MFAVMTFGIALLYFLLAGELSSGEAIGCAITLAIACPYAVAVGRTGTVALRLPARGVRSIVAAFGALVPDLWRVGFRLVHAVRSLPAASLGVVKHIPFRFGAFEAADIGRRAAVTLAVSLAPNGIVLGMDHADDALIVHQLADDPLGGDPEWPV